MPLTIVDEELDAQIRALAERLGATPEAAVRAAVADKLAVTEPPADVLTPAERKARMLAIAREFGAANAGRSRSEDHADLYGDDGLPA